MISLPFKHFTDTYKEQTIGSNTTVTLFTFSIPDSHVAFIDQIRANGDIYDPGVSLKLFIDQEEADEIDRWLVNRPIYFNPPYLATYKIEIIAYNESDRVYDIGVFCDGRVFEEVAALKELKGAIPVARA